MNFLTCWFLGNLFSRDKEKINWKEKKEILEREKQKKEEEERKKLSKVIEKGCLFCKNKSLTPNFNQEVFIKLYKKDRGFISYYCVCKKCGFVHIFHKDTLLKEIKK